VTVAMPVLRLSAGDASAVARAGRLALASDPVEDPEAFARAARDAIGALPADLTTALAAFRRSGSPSGAMLVRHLPVGALPPTPSDPGSLAGARLSAAGCLGAIAGVLGEPCGYAPELGGAIIQDIVPVSGHEDAQRSTSSATALDVHTELAFAPDGARADYLALLCLRGDHDRAAGTTVSPVDAVLARLPKSITQVLREPRFRTSVDQSFLAGLGRSEPIWVGPIHVLSGPAQRPRVRADFAETEGLDPPAVRALAALRAAAEAAALTVVLEPGDLLLFENDRAFHGRTVFSPRWDGRDRWLLRTSLMRDLTRSGPYRPRGGRVIEIDYTTMGASQ
jgi:L-asparagine oxygenase